MKAIGNSLITLPFTSKFPRKYPLPRDPPFLAGVCALRTVGEPSSEDTLCQLEMTGARTVFPETSGLPREQSTSLCKMHSLQGDKGM